MDLKDWRFVNLWYDPVYAEDCQSSGELKYSVWSKKMYYNRGYDPEEPFLKYLTMYIIDGSVFSRVRKVEETTSLILRELYE
jgi:hypothetical protein